MARKADIRLRRSNTANAIPTHSNLSDGEMAMNTMDGALYFKKSDNTIITAVDNTIMHLDSSTNRVGIGTTSPAKELDVFGTVRAHDANSAQHQLRPTGIVTYGTNLRLNAQASGLDIEFQTQGTTHMTILDSGYIGINKGTPTKRLHFKNSANDDNNVFLVEAAGSTTYGVYIKSAFSAQMGRIGAMSQSDGDLDGASIAFEDFGRDIAFRTNEGSNNSEKARLLESGEFGIGTTAPIKGLQLESDSVEAKRSIRLAYDSSYFFDLKQKGAGGIQYNAHNATSGGHRFDIDGAEKFRIAYNGYVGIGTTSPGTLLDIFKDEETWLRISGGATDINGIRFGSSDGSRQNVFYRSRSTDLLTIRAGVDDSDIQIIAGGSSNEIMRFDGTNSRVGIGTTTPGQKLDVAGIIRSTSTNPQLRIYTSSGTGAGYLVFGDSADDDRGWISYQHASDAMEFRVNASVAMTINSNGYLVFPDGQITSDGTNFIIDGASGKEVIVSSARDVRIVIDDNNDDTNNEFQIFKHNDDSASNKILSLTQAGALTVNSAYTFPTADGSANQVLQTDGSGNLSFATVTSGGGATDSITDADGDTKIQVEESSDEDTIRFDVAGSQLMQISSNGVGINEQSIDALLHLSHGTLPNIKFERPGTKKYAMGITGTDFVIDGTNDNLSTPAFLVNTDNDVKVSDHLGINITPDSYSSSLSARLAVGGNVVINHNTPLLYLRSNSSGNDSDLRFQVGLKLTDGSAVVRATINNSGHFQVNERLISDAGVPQLILKTSGTETGYIRSSSNVTQINGTSGVALRHNASTKLNTNSSGVEITGTLTVGSADLIKEENNNLKIQSGQGVIINIDNNDSGPDIFAVTEGSGGATLFQVNQNDNSTQVTGALAVGGDATITGNLTVNGTTTTLNTATLDVEDLNITIAKGITTSTGADGAGITIEGPTNNATMTWDHGNQYLEFNKDIFANAHIIGTTSTKVGRIINASGVFNVEAYSNRQISFGNVDNGEHMRIDASGNVGIGITSPSATYGGKVLHIENNNHSSIKLHDTTGSQLDISARSGDVLIYEQDGYPIRFGINGTEIQRLTTTGLGIGTTTPKAKLQVEEYGIDTTETSTSATTQVAIHTFTATDFRSARYTIQVTNSTDSTYHTSEILLVHDGTDAYITEFGEIHTGTAEEATFDADISSGSVRLLATPASTDAMEFKVVCHSVTV